MQRIAFGSLDCVIAADWTLSKVSISITASRCILLTSSYVSSDPYPHINTLGAHDECYRTET